MAESIDIRDLNERIESRVLSLPILQQAWTKSLWVRNIW